MDDSFNELLEFPVWPLPETATGVLCNCPSGALTKRGWGGEIDKVHNGVPLMLVAKYLPLYIRPDVSHITYNEDRIYPILPVR